MELEKIFNKIIKNIFNNDYENMIFMKTLFTICKFIDQNENLPVVSFSGGKDSTVLLHLIRYYINPKIRGVFLNTGIEYPEIVSFVKKFDNIDIIKPKKSFFQIIKEYGLPIISKEQSRYIEDIQNPNICEKLKKIRLNGKNFCISKKWKYILDENIKVSNKCCYHLKKSPLQIYGKKNKIKYFTGERISESHIRKQKYHTCILPNKCIPLRLWTNEMIDQYIIYHNLEIAKIYKTESRTGCMFCMYGYHFEDINNNRFTRMKKYHPKFYELGCKKINLERILEIINKSREVK